MKFAIAISGDRISGPGEAEEILVYDLAGSAKLEESYENPALKATAARGIVMLKSVMDRGVEKLVISGIGDHALEYAKGKLELLNGKGLSKDHALSGILNNTLSRIEEATHHGGHHHH